jgi:F0F1-type ATP synthase delta subunit
LKFNPKIDKTVIHGVVLQFESLLLDGSLQNSFKEASGVLRQQIEKKYT